MKIYTSYFANIRKIPLNFSLFSIAGKTPDWFPGERLTMFAPKYYWWNEWHSTFKDDLESDKSIKFYKTMYNETVLSKIDPLLMKEMFYKMEKTPCLMCYEGPGKFCHRHLVSDFLFKNGFEAEEY